MSGRKNKKPRFKPPSPRPAPGQIRHGVEFGPAAELSKTRSLAEAAQAYATAKAAKTTYESMITGLQAELAHLTSQIEAARHAGEEARALSERKSVVEGLIGLHTTSLRYSEFTMANQQENRRHLKAQREILLSVIEWSGSLLAPGGMFESVPVLQPYRPTYETWHRITQARLAEIGEEKD